MDRELANPQTVKAIARARKAHAAAAGQWVSHDKDEDDDPASEAEQLATDALAHLDAGRWDEARACAESAQSLAEGEGEDEVWREFALLVEEAAETGRAEPS
jgi:hypothetical protein